MTELESQHLIVLDKMLPKLLDSWLNNESGPQNSSAADSVNENDLDLTMGMETDEAPAQHDPNVLSLTSAALIKLSFFMAKVYSEEEITVLLKKVKIEANIL